jgi:hypothetical protein
MLYLYVAASGAGITESSSNTILPDAGTFAGLFSRQAYAPAPVSQNLLR